MDSRQRQDLDNYITGHYGEDQFNGEEDIDDSTAHECFIAAQWGESVYQYDSADDGPECEVIPRILARHSLYVSGMEKRTIELSRTLDCASIAQFLKRFEDLTEDQRTIIRHRVERAYIALGLA